MRQLGLEVFRVEPGSIAGELGLEPGDRIVRINGEQVRDLIDLRFLETDESLDIIIAKRDGTRWDLDVEKDYDEPLGIDFGPGNFGPTVQCANRCLFCFVDQMPPNMRRTLYLKDDDYRLSFLSGNFITLTNLRDDQLRRIARQRLSPLYISVHTTNPELRERMLGNKKAGLILEQLKYLAGAGIEMHTQVVLCPGINDKKELERTLDDLVSLWPAVSSMALVPVGLTRFRQGCFPLRVFNIDEAARLVQWVTRKQDDCIERLKNPFVFASDEFYLLSGEQIPNAERYAGFPQVENGVGLTRLFQDEWEVIKTRLPQRAPQLKATLATGILGEKALKPVADVLNDIKGLDVSISVINNHFFGKQITVAGLITGQDLSTQLDPGKIGDLLVLPAVMFKKDEEVFLDGMTLPELSRRLKKPIAVADGPRQLIEVLLPYANL
ncbi:DUF512 domain-containing protein [Pelotomaculum isophthalicicum JI]|uniref:DUF512 domain-containing protein n=1 Tax=Pelotomaculum isophthalicicum JI TaxID=947010 RepID=A0A9X4H571_9FIRM|nr:DUF512 domain-containing protein [Pelotomaculum isophthalicicum]MDF9407364.1 DUF512 domain-containing protein [Pelotomaculum isophthalicicum JI]